MKARSEERRAYDRKYYAANKTTRYAQKYALQKKRLRAIQTKFWAYLEGKYCIDCGNRNKIVFDLDHRDPTTKSFNIADSLRSGASFKTIMKEVAKCDIRCANCHRIKTAKQFGWRKAL